MLNQSEDIKFRCNKHTTTIIIKNREPTKSEILKFGSLICQKCGALYRRRYKIKTSNPNQCGHCNRSESAHKRIQEKKERNKHV